MNNKVTFVDAIVLAFKNYVRFRGVASRSEYWYFYLFTILASIVLSTIDGILAQAFGTDLVIGTSELLSLALLLPSLTIAARRYKDSGISAWLLWLQALPVSAAIALIIVAASDPAIQQLLNWAYSNYQPTDSEIAAVVSMVNPNLGAGLAGVLLLFAAWAIFNLIVLIRPTKTRAQGNKYAPEPSQDFTITTD